MNEHSKDYLKFRKLTRTTIPFRRFRILLRSAAQGISSVIHISFNNIKYNIYNLFSKYNIILVKCDYGDNVAGKEVKLLASHTFKSKVISGEITVTMRESHEISEHYFYRNTNKGKRILESFRQSDDHAYTDLECFVKEDSVKVSLSGSKDYLDFKDGTKIALSFTGNHDIPPKVYRLTLAPILSARHTYQIEGSIDSISSPELNYFASLLVERMEETLSEIKLKHILEGVHENEKETY